MPIVSLLLSHVLAHSFVSLLLERAPRFLFPCRTAAPRRAVFLPPSYVVPPAVIGVPNRTPRSAIVTHRAIVVLEQGAVMLSNPSKQASRQTGRQAGSRILAGRLLREQHITHNNGTIVFEFGGRGRIQAGSAHVYLYELSSMSKNLLKLILFIQFCCSLYLSHSLYLPFLTDQLILCQSCLKNV